MPTIQLEERKPFEACRHLHYTQYPTLRETAVHYIRDKRAGSLAPDCSNQVYGKHILEDMLGRLAYDRLSCQSEEERKYILEAIHEVKFRLVLLSSPNLSQKALEAITKKSA